MDRPVKVLHVANQAAPLKLFMLPQCRELRRAGLRVELACMEGRYVDDLRAEGFEVHTFTPGRWSDGRTWWRLYRAARRLLRREAYDVVIVHTPAMSWIVRLAARGLASVVIYMAHGLPFMSGRGGFSFLAARWVERRMARYTDGLIVMNEQDAQAALRERLVRAGGRVFRVPGVGVDVAEWSKRPAQSELDEMMRRFGLDREKPMVLYLGRFIKDKRPGDVVEIARQTRPRASFVLAGEGPLWPAVKRQAEATGEHVRVLDFLDAADVRLLVHACSILVLPSVFREGLPRAILEAQAAGKPVVAYENRGTSDVVVDGRTGLLAPPGDLAALNEAVRRLLDDPELARLLGQAGRQRVQDAFSLDKSLAAQADVMQWATDLARKRRPQQEQQP